MPRVVIVGAGFGGIAAAIDLRRHGLTDVAILDSGRIVTNWPGYMREYVAQTRRLDPGDFEPVSPR